MLALRTLCSATALLAFVPTAAAQMLVTTTADRGVVNTPYSYALQATGGQAPYFYTSEANTFPPGLALDGEAGIISGTPVETGTYGAAVTVWDRTERSMDATVIIIIDEPGNVPSLMVTVEDISLPLGSSAQVTLTAASGVPPYTFTVTVGSLPPGLGISANVLGGTPTLAGAYPIVLEARDAAGATASKAVLISVVDDGTPAVDAGTTADAGVTEPQDAGPGAATDSGATEPNDDNNGRGGTIVVSGRQDSGCGCAAAADRPTRRVPGWALILIAGCFSAVRRRRRR